MSVTFYPAHYIEVEGYGTVLSFVGTPAADAVEVNVCNRNARHLLEVLGVAIDDEDLCGSMTSEDFAGRVLVGSAISPTDEGTATVTTVGEGGATIHDMGRSVGYTDERLREFGELARVCRDNDWLIAWS